MKTFASRLWSCLERGHMTKADLHYWFDRPRATVRTWLAGREPRGPAGDEARRLLIILEQAIDRKRGFPVPVKLSSLDRPHHIKKTLNDNDRAGLPKRNPAGRRVQVRAGHQ